MFRNPHVTLGSVRPLLLGPAVAHACCRCNGAAARAASFLHNDRGVHGTEGPVADRDNGSRSVNLAANRLKADFFLPQDCLPSSSSNLKLFGASRLAFDARSSEAVFKHLAAQNHKTIGSPNGCSQQAAKCLLQPCKSHHHHHPLLSRVAAESQRHPTLLQRNSTHRELFLRPFSTLAYRSRWSLNHLHHSSSSPPQQCTGPSSFGAQFRAQLHWATVPRKEASLKDCLSPENEQRCRRTLAPNQKLYEAAGDDTKARRSQGRNQNQGRWKASVLVSLCSVEEQPAFLFTLRSNALKGRHKGDVSFAGGKSDQADKDVVDTALREAQEELGITVDKRQVWGVLKPLRDMSGMLIAPVLANLGPLEALSFKPNPQEVEEIFTVSLSHVCDTRNRGYTHFRTGDKYGYTLPVFCNGKHRVWGLTAVALDHTLKIIVPPQTTPSRS